VDFTGGGGGGGRGGGGGGGGVRGRAAGWWGLREVLLRPVVDTLRRAAE
jgi:putative ABC transport system permease protein